MLKKSNKKNRDDGKKDELERILKKEKRRDYLARKNLNRFFYWQTLFVIYILNFAAIFLVSPFIFVIDGILSYFLVAIIAISVGSLLNTITVSIENLELKHHYVAFLSIPFLAVVDLVVFFELLDFLGEKFEMEPGFNESVLIILFLVAFVIPYVYSSIKNVYCNGVK